MPASAGSLSHSISRSHGASIAVVLLTVLLAFAPGCSEESPNQPRPLTPADGTVQGSIEWVDQGYLEPGARVTPWSMTSEAADASMDLEIDPGWIRNLAPGEPCGTYPRYLAQLLAEGKDPATAVCAGNGTCDDPVTRNASIPSGSTPVKTCRLYFNVFCNSNGSNCAATQATIDNAVARLNTNYAPWRIQFVYQTRFIKDSKYRVLDSGEELLMKRKYAQTPSTRLNIYVVDAGGVSWGTFPWTTDALTYRGGVVLDLTHLVGGLQNIPTHEVGHCLGLWHTFHGVSEVDPCSDCYEPAGRPPEVGDVTGDFCSDTAPTPRNYTCADPSGTDACSGLGWGATSLTNFMSYGTGCFTEFSPQQAGRMQCWTGAVLQGWLL